MGLRAGYAFGLVAISSASRREEGVPSASMACSGSENSERTVIKSSRALRLFNNVRARCLGHVFRRSSHCVAIGPVFCLSRYTHDGLPLLAQLEQVGRPPSHFSTMSCRISMGIL